MNKGIAGFAHVDNFESVLSTTSVMLTNVDIYRAKVYTKRCDTLQTTVQNTSQTNANEYHRATHHDRHTVPGNESRSL